ncbi:MAG: alpha/beta hydrolase-fold protein [Gemmatimonadota bacterium]|nr:alpha/beta hydrolase-fold protein [Gemmatimonadota bacterium]
MEETGGDAEAAAEDVSRGEATDGRPVSIPHTEVHPIVSGRPHGDLEVWIAHPVAGVMPLPPGPRAVLYLLDANLFFGTAVEMTRIMSQLFGELPPITVVGIAYPTDDPAFQAELRARDFTPSANPGFAAMHSHMPGAPPPRLPEGDRLGGADRFLDLIAERVIPLVEARVDVAPGATTLFGASLGGLFAFHVFLERPGLFDGYIATSPALWWGDEAAFAAEAARAAAADDVDASLVLAVGGLEEDPRIPMLERFKMVTNVERMAETLRARDYARLRLTELVLAGESHTSVVPVALTRGLRLLHPPPSRGVPSGSAP